ncbi:MAG: acetate--CoA ligase [Sediminibacterium sp.]
MKRIESFEQYESAYSESISNPNKFWGEIAESFSWKKKWDTVLSGTFADAKTRWFDGGELNITENLLDRHLTERGNQVALIWEPNDHSVEYRKFTYTELHNEVCIAAEMLRTLGVNKGDRVCIYMSMVPELVFSVLACARIGAVHSVIFGGFSARSIVDRVDDAEADFVITMDGGLRGNKTIPLKSAVDEALTSTRKIKNVLVYNYLNLPIAKNEIDVDWNELKGRVLSTNNYMKPGATLQSEDPLFILYTSGSTGKPKGVVHSTAGYMVWTAYTFLNVFQYEKGDIHFCTADIGWVTGHSYLIYGPLLNGATSLMFEGIPTYPDAGRFWDIVAKHKVNIFYTAPTAIRSLMSAGDEFLEGKDLSSLRVLGSVGEPINEEAWNWYYEKIGKGNCPVVDTFWQTETGGVMISSLAGVTPSKPVFATLPMPGVLPVLLDDKGNEILENDLTGNLCFKQAWPSMIRTTYGDHERCILNYFSTYKNYYFTGDGAYRDEKGMYRLAGRVDDVLNVSGHRIGTAEVENAINHTHGVIESAVVGYPHDIKGQGIYAFVICAEQGDEQGPAEGGEQGAMQGPAEGGEQGAMQGPAEGSSQGFEQEMVYSITKTVSEQIGAIAKPDKIVIVSGLPKTRSGKIMRRILRKIAEGEFDAIGDTTTLLDPSVVQEIIDKAK